MSNTDTAEVIDDVIEQARKISAYGCGLSVRMENRLLEANLRTLGDIADRSRSELRWHPIHPFGDAAIRQLIAVLDKHGLQLRA